MPVLSICCHFQPFLSFKKAEEPAVANPFLHEISHETVFGYDWYLLEQVL